MLKSWLSKPARVVPVSSTPPKGDEGTCRPIPGKRKRDDHDVDDAEKVHLNGIRKIKRVCGIVLCVTGPKWTTDTLKGERKQPKQQTTLDIHCVSINKTSISTLVRARNRYF